MATAASTVTEPSSLIGIQIAESKQQVHADEWALLTLLLSRAASSAGSARIKLVTCSDKEVQLDTDLLSADVEVRPGEVYRLCLPLKASHPKTIDLSTIGLQVATPGELDVLVSLPPKVLTVHPAIGHELRFTLESLCNYRQGVKTQLTLNHRGGTRFDNFSVSLGPESAIIAGKRVVRHPTFNPGDHEQLEVVVAGEQLEICLSAEVKGRKVESRFTRSIPPLAARQERRFRFLEPRRLSLDQKVITEDGSGRPVGPVNAAYPLRAEQRYKIVIRPQRTDVKEVKLRDLPGVAYVLKSEAVDGGWVFLVDVSWKGRFSKPERLFYDVATSDGRLTGEIHVCLKPSRFSHLTLASTLGLALTLQGFGALARFFLKPELSLIDALEDFHIVRDYQLLFALSIPFCWAALSAYDWLQYRLRD